MLERPEVNLIAPGENGQIAGCSRSWEFAYISTKSHPDVVAYRFKDICDVDRCACDVKVSDLERCRHDLSVPWAKAGIVFPPGVKK
jgi:hypothetical protein